MKDIKYLMLRLLRPSKILDYKKSFTSQDEMIAFQSEILKNNLGLSLDQLRQFPIIESHPEYKHITDMPVAPLKTTGTSDNRAKSYWYPEKEYALIQRYHFERLMYVNNIQFGNAVRLVPKGFFENSKKLGLHKCPFDVAMSYSNVTWYAVYPPYNEQSDEFWISLFFSIYQLKPQLVYCSPSELELFADLPIRKPNCPVIVSGETLYPHVRKKVSKIFTSVIDKMRCWDGGLSFFECPFGRKHINDELAVVEKINDVLVSTDLFNVSHNFIRYSNGDSGDIEEGMCQCGIYGKYFSKFDGRTVECLVASDGRIIPGNTVVSRILRTCKQRQSLSSANFKFNVIQDVYKNVTLYGNTELSESQKKALEMELASILNNTKQSDKNVQVRYEKKELFHNNSKQLLVRSYARNL